MSALEDVSPSPRAVANPNPSTMVNYIDVKASNARIGSALPEGLVAVFVGATSGIGEYTLKAFAKHTKSPKVYFIGRSKEAGARIQQECTKLNPSGTFIYISKDTSLLKNVDELCQELKAKEKVINLLILCIGTLDFYAETSEGLNLAAALVYYARTRFIYNLLPELQAATSLKRVVSVFTGTKEGPVFPDDVNVVNIPFKQMRGHIASLVTLAMDSLAQTAPDVSFIHDFPGFVKSGIAKDMPGIVGYVVRILGMIIGPFFSISTEESGAYHLYFATSAQYPAKNVSGSLAGVPTAEGIASARGCDGQTGSGLYCLDEHGESASVEVEALLAQFRNDGLRERSWEGIEKEWRRILG